MKKLILIDNILKISKKMLLICCLGLLFSIIVKQKIFVYGQIPKEDLITYEEYEKDLNKIEENIKLEKIIKKSLTINEEGFYYLDEEKFSKKSNELKINFEKQGIIKNIEKINENIKEKLILIDDNLDILIMGQDEAGYAQSKSRYLHIYFVINWRGRMIFEMGKTWAVLFGLVSLSLDSLSIIESFIEETIFKEFTLRILDKSIWVFRKYVSDIYELKDFIFSLITPIVNLVRTGVKGIWSFAFRLIRMAWGYFIGDIDGGIKMIIYGFLFNGIRITRNNWFLNKNYEKL